MYWCEHRNPEQVQRKTKSEIDLSIKDDHLYGTSRGWKETCHLKKRTHWIVDDLISVAGTSSRESRTSNSSSDSNSSSFRSSGVSISSSRSSSTRSSTSKRSVSCIKTVFSSEEVGNCSDDFRIIPLSSTSLKGYDNDATSTSNDVDLLSRSVLSSPLGSSPATSNFRDYHRVKPLSGDIFEFFDNRRWMGWKLPYQRSSSNVFHSKAKREGGLENSKELRSILIDVHVMRSPGPIRFVVKNNESVKQVINLVLQAYNHQKRFPPLRLSHQQFILYCNNPEFEAMDEDRFIGSYEMRRFYLYPKSKLQEAEGEVKKISPKTIRGYSLTKKRPSIKSWLEMTFTELQSWSSSLMHTLNEHFSSLSNFSHIMNF